MDVRIIVGGPLAELAIGIPAPAADRLVGAHGARVADAAIEPGDPGERARAPDHLYRLEPGMEDRVARRPLTELTLLIGPPAPGGPVAPPCAGVGDARRYTGDAGQEAATPPDLDRPSTGPG